MSVTAPAEVVARNPLVVSVPFDGVIESVLVKPNQIVKRGDLLVTMESTVLRNKSEMMSQELATAQEALTKTEREALRDPTKLPELSVLRAQIREKEADK
jgi:multidrug efflux pump subunit AcrA (membrane-fusion protein)